LSVRRLIAVRANDWQLDLYANLAARIYQRPEIVIYRACAVTIFSRVLLAATSSLLSRSISLNSRLLFVSEVLAMLAAGISWFVPGQAIVIPAQTLATTLGPVQVVASAEACPPAVIMNAQGR
jgi:hypothetical protein